MKIQYQHFLHLDSYKKDPFKVLRHFAELFLFFAHNLLENSLINLATHVFSSFIFYGYIQL